MLKNLQFESFELKFRIETFLLPTIEPGLAKMYSIRQNLKRNLKITLKSPTFFHSKPSFDDHQESGDRGILILYRQQWRAPQSSASASEFNLVSSINFEICWPTLFVNFINCPDNLKISKLKNSNLRNAFEKTQFEIEFLKQFWNSDAKLWKLKRNL